MDIPSYAAGLAVIVIYVGLAYLMATRKLSMLLGLPIMSFIVGLIGGASIWDILTAMGTGSYRYASLFAIVMVGGWLADFVVKSGIAEDFIRRAVELAGDRKTVLAIVVFFAVGILFFALTGLGAVIMIGSIVIPIMLAAGIDPTVAGTIMSLGIALGNIWNIRTFGFWTQLSGLPLSAFFPFVPIVTVILIAASLTLIYFRVHKQRLSLFDSGLKTEKQEVEHKRVHTYALLAPIIPIIAAFGLGLDLVMSFVVGIVFTFFATLESLKLSEFKRNGDLVARSFADGIALIAPILALYMGVGMLAQVIGIKVVGASISPFFSSIFPKSPWAVVVFFAIVMPLVLFRGPFNLVGLRAGIIPLLINAGIWSKIQVTTAFYAMDPLYEFDPTYSDRIWIGQYVGTSSMQILKQAFIYMYVAGIICEIVAVLLYF